MFNHLKKNIVGNTKVVFLVNMEMKLIYHACLTNEASIIGSPTKE